MILLKEAAIDLFDKVVPIESWEVWFKNPFGLFQSLDLAIQSCEKAGLDPELHILPIPVAVGDSGDNQVYECAGR